MGNWMDDAWIDGVDDRPVVIVDWALLQNVMTLLHDNRRDLQVYQEYSVDSIEHIDGIQNISCEWTKSLEYSRLHVSIGWTTVW